MSLSFSIVVAADDARGIGKSATLPWRLPGDMAFFKRITSEAQPGRINAVIMGRKTFASIPTKFRPLSGRLNIVLTRTPHGDAEDVIECASLEAAFSAISARSDVDQVFVIGGGEIYALALSHPECARLYLTRVAGDFGCDVHLPAFEQQFQLADTSPPHSEHGISYTFTRYERARPA